ncbi:hypothetical protein Tco_1474455 [Tanacetum coccineum]
MNPIVAQQTALDNALVAPDDRVKIGKCNMRIDPTKTYKEPTYQVVLDALALSPCYPAFLITADVLEIYMQQFWFTISKIKDSSSYQLPNQEFVKPPSDEEIITFIKELGYKGDLGSVNEGMFYNKNVDYVDLLWEDFMFQIDNRESINDDSVLGSLKFVSKTKESQVYGVTIPEVMTNQKTRNSTAYKTYLAFSTGATTPKKAKKFKYPCGSTPKKQSSATFEEPAKKPATRRQPTGVQIRDTPGVFVSKKKTPTQAERNKGTDLLYEAALLEEAQMKKAIKRSKQETYLHQAGGSCDGAGFQPEVPDEPKGKSINTHEGTSLKPEVLDVSKADSSDSEYESWGVSDDDDDDQQDYLHTDDETNDVDDEEYIRINEEMYDDLNVELKDAELDDEEKGDAEMEDVAHVNDEETQEQIVVVHKEINPEAASAQVQNVAQATTIVAPATQMQLLMFLNQVQFIISHPTMKPCVIVTAAPTTTTPPPRPPFFTTPQQSTPIPRPTTTEAITATIAILKSTTLSAIHQRVSDLEKEVKILRNVNHNSLILTTIMSEVPIAVKECLGTNLEDTLNKLDKAALKEFDQKRTLFETMTKSKSFDRNPKYMALYHALIESILVDEDAMDKGVADKLKKKKPDDVDRDEDPLAGPDQGLKRQKSSKDDEPTKKAKSTDTSKGTTKSQPKSTGKSSQAEETKTCKTVDDGPTQNWLSDLAKAEKPSKTFNELMSTPIDFTAFTMNRLHISDLTKADLVGPVYNLLKGTCKSCMDLKYNMEECYKALNDQLDWNNPEGDRYPFDLSKPLPLVESRNRLTVPTKAAKYDLQGIEDMVSKLWSPIKVAYNRHALLEEIEVRRSDQKLYKFVEGDFPRLHLNDIKDMLLLVVQNRLYNLDGEVIVHLAATLRMFTRRTVIHKRVEDLQIGVESYQKKLNISRPLTHKFSYGTLISVRDKLKDMANNLEMGYNSVMPRRRWSNLDKKRSRIMVKDINRQLLERRLLRSLEKFVGGREYEEDLKTTLADNMTLSYFVLPSQVKPRNYKLVNMNMSNINPYSEAIGDIESGSEALGEEEEKGKKKGAMMMVDARFNCCAVVEVDNGGSDSGSEVKDVVVVHNIFTGCGGGTDGCNDDFRHRYGDLENGGDNGSRSL